MTKNITFKSKNRGFTLIELLVVIVIIAIISTLVIVNVNSSRVKSRDARRKADLLLLSAALEQYYTENRVFPHQVVQLPATSGAFYSAMVAGGYIQSIPADPLSPASSTKPPYYYVSDGTTSWPPTTPATTSTQYVIFAKLERINDSDVSALKYLPITNTAVSSYALTVSGTSYTYNYWVSSK